MGSSSALVNEMSGTKALSRTQQTGVRANEAALRRPVFAAAVPVYLLFCLVTLCSALWLPSLEDPYCFGISRDKHRILDQAKSPKIVFIGGSNLLFGLDGERIQRELGMPVVNMGLCLKFPLPYIFEEIKARLHKGDIVVLSPEIPALYASTADLNSRGRLLGQLLDGHSQAIQWMLGSDCASYDQKISLLNHLCRLGFNTLVYALNHIGPILKHECCWRQGPANPGLKVLCTSELDGCGGLVWHLRQPRQSYFNPAEEFSVPDQPDHQTIAQIHDFDRYCCARGTRFVLIPSPIPHTQLVRAQTRINHFMAECQHRLAVPFIASQQRYTFPDTMIFNGNFHLNKVGRQLRTDRVIEDLRPLLATNWRPPASALTAARFSKQKGEASQF